jgi:DNA-binding response OmpR family regulator
MNNEAASRIARVLIVEDDSDVREALKECLKQRGCVVSAYGRARAAIDSTRTQEFDLAIVDLRLPDLHGSALIERFRRSGLRFPIMAITAASAVDERVAALNAGASDYLTKPFSLGDLHSRIDVLLRRAQSDDSAGSIRVGNLVLVPGDPRVLIGDQPVYLSGQELTLLQVLASNVGQVIPIADLTLQLSRNSKPVSDTAVSLTIYRLRSRLHLAGVRIRTLRGFGYVLEAV